MRIVLDTNVLVSAALKRNSIPATVVGAVRWYGVLLKSKDTERQLFDVIARPYFTRLIGPDVREWMHRLIAAAEPIAITERIAACRDPTDDKFLELAVNGRADLIVSGDGDLLALDPFQGIPIVSPATFLQRTRR